jgi:hypothetical protein
VQRPRNGARHDLLAPPLPASLFGVGTPAEFRELIASDTEKIGKVIRVANITIE